jgi:ribonuclease HII
VWIKKVAISWAIGEVSVGEINKFGMAKSLGLSYKRAVRGLNQKVDKVLLDGIEGIVKGDQKCFSISCASIIAKVYRDNILCDIGKKPEFSAYLWCKIYGYGTRDRDAIHMNTKYHRKFC